MSIRGTNFLAGALVLFGNVAAPTVDVNSPTKIQALTPAHSVAAVDVAVQKPDGQSAIPGSGFTYQESPIRDEMFSDGFESGDFSKWDFVCPGCGGGDDPTKAKLDSTIVHSGAYSVRLFYNIPSKYGDDHQDDNVYVEKIFSPGLSEFYIRGYVYFKTPEPGGSRAVGRKVYYLKSGNSGTDQSTWACFLTSDPPPGSQIQLRVECGGTSVTSFTHYSKGFLRFDQWYAIELHVKANTPRQSDGVLEIWLDNKRVLSQTGVNMRGKSADGIKWFDVGNQADRTARTPVKEYRYWDDIVIRTSGPIGPDP